MSAREEGLLARLVFEHTGEQCSFECGEGFGYHDVESSEDRRRGCEHIAEAILASDWLADFRRKAVEQERERIAQAIEAEDCGTRQEILTELHDGCPDRDSWPAAECRACGVATKAWLLGVEHMRTDAARIARADWIAGDA